MSLVTLKKKTEATIKNISTGQRSFSLNGTRRGLTYIGQSTQSKHINRKYIKDANHGGCCDSYLVKPLSDGILKVNDYSAVKLSSMNTKGFLSKCSMKCGTPVVKQVQYGYSMRYGHGNNYEGCNIQHTKTNNDGKPGYTCSYATTTLFSRHYGSNKKNIIESSATKNISDDSYKPTYEDRLHKLRTQCSIQKYYKPSICQTPMY
jgi:hypothetical protein